MLNENDLEQTVLSWLSGLGFTCLCGPDIAPGELLAERAEFSEVVLKARLQDALARLNPSLDSTAIDEAVRKLLHPSHVSLIRNNHTIHNYLVNGVPIDITRPDGGHGVMVRVIDFENPDNNDWLAVNQFAVIEGKINRRPDIVIFVNGLPLGVIELKNPADENATIWSAFNQLQTYKQQIPFLFLYNAALIVSDGLEARIGSLTADRERFMPWRTVEGEELASSAIPQLEVLLKGAFDKRRFLDLVRHFIVFEDEDGGQLIKKMAGYHQFHAVNAAVEETLRASNRYPDGTRESEGKYYSRADKAKEKRDVGDKRVGVIWHTQGSGKSLTMAFYAGKVILNPAMENPTLVILTDRNDLDDQLFGTFSRCHELLRQTPVQAGDRKHLRELLQVASGGVVFTTIQKFFPEEKGDTFPMLSDRRNIVVIADEAHRSQYDFIDGYARICGTLSRMRRS